MEEYKNREMIISTLTCRKKYNENINKAENQGSKKNKRKNSSYIPYREQIPKLGTLMSIEI